LSKLFSWKREDAAATFGLLMRLMGWQGNSDFCAKDSNEQKF
jgi:hypothetical protein